MGEKPKFSYKQGERIPVIDFFAKTIFYIMFNIKNEKIWKRSCNSLEFNMGERYKIFRKKKNSRCNRPTMKLEKKYKIYQKENMDKSI